MQPKHGLLLGLRDNDHPQYVQVADHTGASHDHGSLGGLADDDHPQYLLVTAKYTDAEAVAAVLAADDYVKIGGDTMTGALLLPNGTALLPSLRFTEGNGMYLYGTDQLGFAAGDAVRFRIDASNAKFAVNLLPETEAVQNLGSSINAWNGVFAHNLLDEAGTQRIDLSTLRFNGHVDPNSNLAYDLGDSSLRWRTLTVQNIVSGGGDGPLTLSGSITSNSGANIELYGHTGTYANDIFIDAQTHQWRDFDGTPDFMRLNANGIYLYMTGSASTPAIALNDANTGLYAIGTEISLGSDGREMFTGAGAPATDEVRILPAYANSVTSGDDYVGVTSTGLLRRQTSTLRNKENIEPADWLADIPLFPVEFDTKRPEGYDDENEFVVRHGYGLIAEQVAAVLPHGANYEPDGRVGNYQDRAILAILAAKTNDIVERLERLEAA